MALILNRDLDGHGNCNADGKYVPLTKVNRPDGTTALVRTGGTHLRLGTAKADGIVFAPWKIIPCSSDRQEAAILSHCAKTWGAGKGPIRRFDWRDEVLVAEWRLHNPDSQEIGEIDAAVESGDKGLIMAAVASVIAATSNGPARPVKTVPQTQDINTAPRSDRFYSEGTSAGRAAQVARGRVDKAEVDARVGEYADAVYQETFDRNRAKGHTEARATHFAEVARDAAVKRGPAPPTDAEDVLLDVAPEKAVG